MKTKKSIRKLTPIARKCAKISRGVHSIRRQLDGLTEIVAELEFDNRALGKAAQERWGLRSGDQVPRIGTEAVSPPGGVSKERYLP